MITTLLLAASLVCPKPQVINESKQSWNEIDQWNLNIALNGCARKYEKSPCMKKFIKRAPQVYAVVCSAPIKD